MMRTLLLIPVLITFFGFTSTAQDISGSWSWNSANGGDMFTVDLIKISDGNYSGNHCSVYLEGDRIDCNDQKEEFTIVLIRKAENIFQGSIRSGLSYTVGNVQIQYLPIENRILFNLTTAPKGIFYIPTEAVMQR